VSINDCWDRPPSLYSSASSHASRADNNTFSCVSLSRQSRLIMHDRIYASFLSDANRYNIPVHRSFSFFSELPRAYDDDDDNVDDDNDDDMTLASLGPCSTGD
jgi:hypothetical protein